MAGSLLIPQLVPNPESVPLMLLILTLTSLIVALFTFFMPVTPPTVNSASGKSQRLNFYSGLRQIARNKQFWLLVFIFSVNQGLINAFSTLLNQILSPYDYSDKTTGMMGCLLIGIGSPKLIVLSGFIVDRTGAHKKFLRTFTPLMAVTYFGYCWTIKPDAFWSIIINISLNGIASLIPVPITLELGAECTYPCSESTSTSILWQVSQIFAIIFVTIEDRLRDPNGIPPNNYSAALTFQAFVASTAGILVFFYDARNLRSENEAELKLELSEPSTLVNSINGVNMSELAKKEDARPSPVTPHSRIPVFTYEPAPNPSERFSSVPQRSASLQPCQALLKTPT
ncbi:uncharacterized protein VTP21DRAFT_5098 [Calcarisporiella thermophila]|uniref:uncharacterized protein n=1 Tax=Calcarisporiella thermophila TaxID=911321 RepID=UPI0037443643